MNYEIIDGPDGPLDYGDLYGNFILVRLTSGWSGVHVAVFINEEEPTDEVKAATLAIAEAIRDLLNA